MRHYILFRQVFNRFTGSIAVAALTSCSVPTAFEPVYSPNPWSDDYSAVSDIENYKQWGTYNVHDPSCKKIGDTYYMYSTDAIYFHHRPEPGDMRPEDMKPGDKRPEDMKPEDMKPGDMKPGDMKPGDMKPGDMKPDDMRKPPEPMGFIQVRKSKDLVNWEYVGWAFPEIPAEAVAWVKSQAGGEGATNIWAPFIMPYKDKLRLYYCVSAFGKNTSYIGLAESTSPEGPWTLVGCVVQTGKGDAMNAIDPSVIEDSKTGKWWMHYGSYFGGLFCVELNPETGLPVKEGDKGHLIARRANYAKDNLEAPDIMYNAKLDKYYLFTSYDPLMTTYNVRVARSDTPDGPFLDFYGDDIADTTNNVPILTAPYKFDGHQGWAGTGHCGIIASDGDRFFMAHQSRLCPRNEMMDLHVREVFFTSDGWPVVSPERYTGSEQRSFTAADISGDWEMLLIKEPPLERGLEAGQVLWGEGGLQANECATSETKQLDLSAKDVSWSFNEAEQLLTLKEGDEETELIVFAGHDWERETETILVTGLDSKGHSVWGKKVKSEK